MKEIRINIQVSTDVYLVQCYNYKILRYEKLNTLNTLFLDSEWLFYLVPNKYLHRSTIYVSNDLKAITEKSKRLKVRLVFG